jgi:16S rRNA (guanine1207-N2)-methyltransferase
MMTEHYFSAKPKSIFREETFKTGILGQQFLIHTAPSIFSSRRVDFGTRLLIEKAVVQKNAEVLDLGCGYGIVGIAIKKKQPDIRMTMSDINERAVILARKNCRVNSIECEINLSDIFDGMPGREFDAILTNPPFSAGKKICEQFIAQSHSHLTKGGSLQLVAPHNKGGSSLKKMMEERFGNVKSIAKRGGYQVYLSIK